MTTPSLAELRAKLEPAVAMLRESQEIVAFTGAGISTESGIPDYRGPNGVWQTQRPPHIDDLQTDEAARRQHWQGRRQSYPEMLAREPNQGHAALAELERAGKLRAIVTQNIDGLHQKGGNHPDHVIELHGSTHELRCLDCGRITAGTVVQAQLEAGDPDPRCGYCGGALRSGTVLFGEALPEEPLRLAFAVAQASNLMIVAGSSLVVNPAARIPVIAKQSGARLIIVNREETPLDTIADIRIEGELGPTLTHLTREALREEGS